MKIVHVVGARPNFMKIAPILETLRRQNGGTEESRIESLLVHTGQHYDYSMSESFFEDLGMPRPDFNLEIGTGSHAEQTGRIMIAFEPVLRRERPDLVLVVGDVNSTMACAVTAKKMGIPSAHVEAGLRSGDMTMPEEINRKVTDAISDYFFTTDRIAGENLRNEGIPQERIHFVGNVMIDTLLNHIKQASGSPILENLGLKKGKMVEPYAVVTLHRPSNVDDEEVLREICEALRTMSERFPVIFPCHPRTEERIRSFNLEGFFGGLPWQRGQVFLTPPLRYLDFLRLNAHAKVILTDSGGVQEESTILGVPCLTLRKNTERPITILQGTNRLVGNRKASILRGFETVINEPAGIPPRPDRWDGKAAERIAGILLEMAESGGPRFREDGRTMTFFREPPFHPGAGSVPVPSGKEFRVCPS